MPDVLMVILSVATTVLGMAWLALSMDVHWAQALGDVPQPPSAATLLRVLGSATLVVSLGLCLSVDHVSMASLVWVMAVAGGALLVAFTLSWRPQWLAPLLPWVRRAQAA